MSKRIAGYTRVSRVGKRQGDSYQSPGQQRDAIIPFSRAHGHELNEIAHEEDVSGGTMARPELERLVRKIEDNELDGIVVARLDRFARTLSGGLQMIERISNAGGFVQTVDGVIDTAVNGNGKKNATANLQLQLFLVLAEWERSNKAESLEHSKERAVARGVHISGKVPVGYTRVGRGQPLTLDEGTAPAVRAAFALRAGGAGIAETARLLDERLPKRCGAWSPTTVAAILRNRVYLGEARQGGYVLPDAHPAIVDEDTFLAVQTIGARPERRPPPSTLSLLAGIARCGCCGYALDRGRQSAGSPRFAYRCRGRWAGMVCTEPTSVPMDALDAYVDGEVRAKLADEQMARVATQADVDQVHAHLAALKARRELFEDDEYAAQLGKEAALRALRKIDAKIADLAAELGAKKAEQAAPGPDIQAALELWDDLSVNQRREVIGVGVDAVTVSRAPRGTPLVDRVTIHWRGSGFRRPSRGTKVEAGVAAA